MGESKRVRIRFRNFGEVGSGEERLREGGDFLYWDKFFWFGIDIGGCHGGGGN